MPKDWPDANKRLMVEAAAAGTRGSPLGERLSFVFAVYGASRLFYLVAGALFAGYLPMGDFYHITPDEPLGTLGIWAHWDGVWYSNIAAEGYEDRAPASTAFFPLYPLLVRCFAELFGGPSTLGALSVWGMLVSILALPFGLYFVYRITEDGWGPGVARRTVLLLAFFPTSFFLNAAYTESLFLALSAGSLWAIGVRKDLLLACLLAAFATATRNVGIFLVVPLALEWLRDAKVYRWRFLYLALAPSGLVTYAAYLGGRFGDPLLFQAAQAYWNRRFIDPITLVVDVVTEAYEGLGMLLSRPPTGSALGDLMAHLSGPSDTYNLLFLLFAAVLLVLGLRVLPPSLGVYSFLLVIPTAFVGKPETPLMGFPRYVLVAFPLFIVLGVLLKDRRALGGWLVLSVASSLVLCALFVSWRFVA